GRRVGTLASLGGFRGGSNMFDRASSRADPRTTTRISGARIEARDGGELLVERALFVARLGGHHDLHLGVEVAPPTAALGIPPLAQANPPSARRAGRYLHLHDAVERLERNAPAEHGLVGADPQAGVDVVALDAEAVVGDELDPQEEVDAPRALAGQADALPLAHPRRHRHREPPPLAGGG